MIVELKLRRRKYRDVQVLGTMDIFKDNEYICTLATLEKSWKNNERNISCVPPSFYIVEHYHSEKHPNSFVLQDTAPRTNILIHSGNYHNHTAGCILVGLTHQDINNDGYYDVKYSSEAYDKLRKICKHEDIISLNIS